ncbi:uncharacterized protein LOC143538880 [Bidens hawaiensis]|uniref:uncharacterized protein LOC143538880 n=1 Tax=Bidens hawaiensis TaxID=980011 RepID=UPI00404918B4
MFSSNPCSQFPSSTSVFSPTNSIFDYEKDDYNNNNAHFNYYQQIHNPFLSSQSSDFDCHTYSHPSRPFPVTYDVSTLKQDFGIQPTYSANHNNDLLESVVFSCNKKMGTSHSKIHTAQGPRDRRVRLSIDISRKFFYLQDLLGFDKASKTLDWLLAKSLTAITDFVCSSSTVTDESKARYLETIKGDISDEKIGKKKSLLKRVDAKVKKTTKRSKNGNQSREQSRAEARARARERTKQKSHLKMLNSQHSSDQTTILNSSKMELEHRLTM